MYNLKLVCEGPTDLEVLQALLDAHLGDRGYLLTMIQTEGSLLGGHAGAFGGGWKGVRGWCQDIASGGGLQATGALTPDVDLLVIHVDADIAADPELACAHPCPPPEDTVAALEQVVCGWLGVHAQPDRVVFWIPSMATEAWILSALHPAHAPSCLPTPPPAVCVECLQDPAHELVQLRSPLIKRRQGRLRKIRNEYRGIRGEMEARWGALIQNVQAARHLHQQLCRWIPWA